MFGKKKVSREEWVELLLKIPETNVERLSNLFKDAFNYSGEIVLLKYEVKIFLLWLVIASLPSWHYPFRNLIIDKYCAPLLFDTEKREFLYEEIEKRFSNYFEAFLMWQNNPARGNMLGTVIIEIVINQNPDFSLKEYVPLVGATQSLKAFMVFGDLYKLAIKTTGEIEKKVKIVN